MTDYASSSIGGKTGDNYSIFTKKSNAKINGK